MKVVNLKSKTDLLKLKKEISSYNNNIYFQSYPINDLKEVRYNIVKSNSFLPKVVDSGPYKEYIDNRKISTCFRNLAGDVKLVIPIKPYPTIYYFALNGSEKEWLALFNKVVNNFKKEDKFISTHGHGVAWLHVRIEKYPKYYKIR